MPPLLRTSPFQDANTNNLGRWYRLGQHRIFCLVDLHQCVSLMLLCLGEDEAGVCCWLFSLFPLPIASIHQYSKGLKPGAFRKSHLHLNEEHSECESRGDNLEYIQIRSQYGWNGWTLCSGDQRVLAQWRRMLQGNNCLKCLHYPTCRKRQSTCFQSLL